MHQQVPAGVELSVGIVRDDALGPMVVVAAGGVLVELLADRAVALPPLTHEGALRMLDRLRLRPLLDGFRGAPPVDLDALADVIVKVARLAPTTAATSTPSTSTRSSRRPRAPWPWTC